MKRKIVTACIIVVCFLLECTIFDKLSFGYIKPNLMVVVTSSFGFMRGKKTGMIVGFASGLLRDVMFGDLVGFYALIYTLIGYANGMFERIFYGDDIKLPLILIGASDFVYGNMVCIFMFVMRSRFHYGYYFGNIIIPELIYTILVTLLLYQIILYFHKKLEAEEQRSASKFV